MPVWDIRPFQPEDADELEQMMLALYREDPEGEPLTPEKIARTIDELTHHPEKGRILIFSVNRTITGYGLVIIYWSNEFGGNILLKHQDTISYTCFCQ